jgi:DNA polymerase-1
MIDYLALAGDSSDNIPGVKGVGEKTAADLLSRYADIEDILANAHDIKGKLGQKLMEGAEDARMSKFLTTIRIDVPVEPNWDEYVLGEPDKEKLSDVCKKFELNRLAKVFGLNLGAQAEEMISSSKETQAEEMVDIATWPHTYSLVDSEQAAKELIEELSKVEKIAFDTETAPGESGDATDPHTAKLVGFSFAISPGKAWYVVGDLIDLFRPVFSDPSKIFVAHNVKFDMTVLHRYGIGFASTPRDTMLLDYCIDASQRHSLDVVAEKYLKYRPIPIEKLIGEKERGKQQLSMASLKPQEICDYAAEDADVVYRLEEVLNEKVASQSGVLNALRHCEEPLVKVLIDMEREGVKIDVESLKEYGKELDKLLVRILEEISSYSGPGLNVDSPKQLGEFLFNSLSLPGGRKTAKGQYSTDEKTLSKLIDVHPVVGKILEYRTLMKLKSTYVDKLPLLIDEHGRIHTTYSQAFTETGRISSANPNLQNIPIRTSYGKLVRKAFVARDDKHVLISADYSQIELRIIAGFSRDKVMLEAFEKGQDIHIETASRVFNVMPMFVTEEQRSKCKAVNFGIIYGMSAFGLAQRLKISRKEAASLIEMYFKLYPGVAKYIEQLKDKAHKNGYAETFLGRRRYLRDINSANATLRQSAERDAINTPIQGSAADLIKTAMVNVDAALKAERLRSKMILQIHDELVFDVPIEEVERAKEIIAHEMKTALDFGVPLEVGIGVGHNWLESH